MIHLAKSHLIRICTAIDQPRVLSPCLFGNHLGLLLRVTVAVVVVLTFFPSSSINTEAASKQFVQSVGLSC